MHTTKPESVSKTASVRWTCKLHAVKPEDVIKTAFTMPRGLYEYTMLCSALTSNPGTFQAVMNDVLNEVIGKFVLVYLDDTVIFSSIQSILHFLS